MKISFQFAVALFACSLMVAMSGCGKDYELAPVSGKVTLDGDPVAKLKIVFYPKGTKENLAPGPLAKATTDANGMFTLVSRDGSNGATVGPNRVAFETAGEGVVSQEDLDEAAASIDEAEAEGDSAMASKAKKHYQKLLKRFEGKPSFPESLANDMSRIFEVPSEGTDAANFDLKSDQ